MARLVTKPLSDTEVKAAKPGDKPKHLFDGKGLFLLIPPAKFGPDGKPKPASKWWRFKYSFAGKSKTISLGTYPEISLADARQRRNDARKLLANNTDPGEVRKAQKEKEAAEERTFEVVAREWFAKNETVWSKSHCSTVMGRLVRDIFPVIGGIPIAEVKRSDIIGLLKGIEARGKIETAKRIKIYCGQIFRYALNHGWVDSNPTSDMKVGDIIAKVEAKHHAAITDPKQLGELLRAIEGYSGTFTVKCALRLFCPSRRTSEGRMGGI